MSFSLYPTCVQPLLMSMTPKFEATNRQSDRFNFVIGTAKYTFPFPIHTILVLFWHELLLQTFRKLPICGESLLWCLFPWNWGTWPNLMDTPLSPALDINQLPTHYDLRVDSLTPLPPSLSGGLIAVTFFGFLSFFASVTLFILLSWRICKWFSKAKSTNQFVVLIYNLVLADIQQSIAFVLNAKWLVENGITTGTSTCWAQGW